MVLGNTPRQHTHLFLEQAKSFALELRFIDPDGQPFPLTDHRVAIVVKEPAHLGDTEIIQLDATLDDEDDSITRFLMQAADLDLEPAEYPYDITLYADIGYSTPVLKGAFVLGSNADSSTGNIYSDVDPTKGVLITMGSTEVVSVQLDYNASKGDKGDKGDQGDPGGIFVQDTEPDPETDPAFNPLWVDTGDLTEPPPDPEYAPIDHNHDGVYAPFDHNHDSRYYLQGQVDDAINSRAPAIHDHDGRYYTEAEIDAQMAGKAAATHDHDSRYYTEAQTDSLLTGKAAAVHNHDDLYYTESEVDTKLSGKSNVGHGHDDQYIREAPTDGAQYARQNAGWVVVESADGGVTDHGALTGLADDDHPHYLTNARGDARYAAINHNHDTSYYTKVEMDAKLAAKAASGHTHDDRYYTQSYLDDELQLKAPLGHTHDNRYYQEWEIDQQFAAHVPNAHTHVEADITDLGDYTTEAPIDGRQYARTDGGWAVVTAADGLGEAPIDGTPYARQDGTWVPSTGGGGASKFADDLPATAAGTAITVTHSRGTQDIIVQVYEKATGVFVACDIVADTVDTVQLTFGVAIADAEYRVVVI